MAIYAIGDLQGCYAPLQALIKKIAFDPTQDHLWFTGDLINRGHDSLGCLRFVKAGVEKGQATTVLGNHDLHLLAVGAGIRGLKPKDTFQDILHAADSEELLEWLRQQPLLHYDSQQNYVMVHAGIPPHWTLDDARHYHDEIIHILRGPDYKTLLKHMYSQEPVNPHWDAHLSKWERYRLIIDYFTRMRFCNAQGELELRAKSGLDEQPEGYFPWFRVPNRVNANLRIIFGHWAALRGEISDHNLFALDTGCVWGNCLTAMRLVDQQRFSVSCAE